jgi:hypothetical protein
MLSSTHTYDVTIVRRMFLLLDKKLIPLRFGSAVPSMPQ